MKHFNKSDQPDLPFKKAVKKKIPIRCCQIHQPFSVQTKEGKLEGAPGDYLMVGVEDELYPCSKEVFAESYTLLEINEKIHFESLDTLQLPFRLAVKKPLPVRYLQMQEPFIIEGPDGKLEGGAGDYLMVGVKGELYPCSKEVFEKTYEKV